MSLSVLALNLWHDAGPWHARQARIRFMRGAHAVGDRSVYFNDAWKVAGEHSLGSGFTWCNRNPYAQSAHEPDKRIDYIFSGYPCSDGRGILESCRVVCNDEKDGVWPTGHFGVFAELRTEPVA